MNLISFEYNGVAYVSFNINEPESREYLEKSTGLKLFEPILDAYGNKIYDEIEISRPITKTISVQKELFDEKLGGYTSVEETEEIEDFTIEKIQVERVKFINPNPEPAKPPTLEERINALENLEIARLLGGDNSA